MEASWMIPAWCLWAVDTTAAGAADAAELSGAGATGAGPNGAELTGIDGILGTRGSIMLDLVFVAMFVVVPLLGLSWTLAKRGHFAAHKKMQMTLALVLLVAVGLFELDMRIHGWEHRAMPSPYWRAGRWNDAIDWSLLIHLFCAVPTFFIWSVVLFRAWRNFPHPPAPSAHSRWHRRWGWGGFIGMTLTAVTGWIFYWLAFVASA